MRIGTNTLPVRFRIPCDVPTVYVDQQLFVRKLTKRGLELGIQTTWKLTFVNGKPISSIKKLRSTLRRILPTAAEYEAEFSNAFHLLKPKPHSKNLLSSIAKNQVLLPGTPCGHSLHQLSSGVTNMSSGLTLKGNYRARKEFLGISESEMVSDIVSDPDSEPDAGGVNTTKH